MAAGPLTYANKQIINTNNYDDDSDIDAETLKPKIIEAFEKKEFKHPRKPELKPVKVYDVIPEKGFIHKEFTVFNFYEHPYNLD